MTIEQINQIETLSVSDVLEYLVDHGRLSFVLESLSDVCREKADHIRENWQDDTTARTWESAARYITSCSAKDSVRAVSR